MSLWYLNSENLSNGCHTPLAQHASVEILYTIVTPTMHDLETRVHCPYTAVPMSLAS